MCFIYAEKTYLNFYGEVPITVVGLTSCLSGSDSAALLRLNYQQIYLFGRMQTSKTGVQQYSDTSPYEESLYSLERLVCQRTMCATFDF